MAESKCKGEPSLSEILEDPIVRDLMERDGVSPEALEILVGKLRKPRSEAETILASNYW